jgi:hypothetical protein
LLPTLVALVALAWDDTETPPARHVVRLDRRGLITWVLATVIVWAAALLAGFLLRALFVKRIVGEARG